MSDVLVQPVLPAGLPEGWTFPHELPCPACGYNLRMLCVPRCPECGLVFRWQALLHITCPRCDEPLLAVDGAECPRCKLDLNWTGLLRDAHVEERHLFEYSNRPARAALRTWVAALRPRRFWRSIRLESPPVVRRIALLRRVAVGTCLVGLIALLLHSWLAMRLPGAPLPTLWPAVCLSTALVLALPVVTTVSLPLFGPTLARFRVRRDQLLRCLAYACTGLLWIGISCFIATVTASLLNYFWPARVGWVTASGGGPVAWSARIWFAPEVWVQGLSNPAVWTYQVTDRALLWFNAAILGLILFFGFVWWWPFVYVALRRYLRLDRPNAVALFLSTQVIGVLALLALMLQSSQIAVWIGTWLLRLQGALTGR